MESLERTADPAEALTAANAAARVEQVLERYPELKSKIDDQCPVTLLAGRRLGRAGRARRNGWNRETEDYAGTMEALCEAGPKSAGDLA